MFQVVAACKTEQAIGKVAGRALCGSLSDKFQPGAATTLCQEICQEPDYPFCDFFFPASAGARSPQQGAI